MSKHTKGPWKLDRDWSVTGDGAWIADINLWGDDTIAVREEAAANARLIAAAPRMFSVIEKIAADGDPECIAIVEAINGRG